MFAYLLILAELCILATVFWYVFVREPRPIEISENLWGCYNSPLDAVTGYGIKEQLQDSSQGDNDLKRARKSRRSNQVVLLRSSRHGIKRKHVNVNFDLKNGWVELDGTRQSGFIATALSGIAEKLNQLCMRLS